MNFRVETAALRAANTRLVALGTDTGAARTYTADHLDISGDDNGLLFVHVDNVCTDVRTRVFDVIGRLHTLLDSCGAELSAAATYYDQTDEATLRRMDAQIARESLPDDERYDDDPVTDTVPEDPGDWTPPEDEFELDDGEVLMAPGPFGYESPGRVQA